MGTFIVSPLRGQKGARLLQASPLLLGSEECPHFPAVVCRIAILTYGRFEGGFLSSCAAIICLRPPSLTAGGVILMIVQCPRSGRNAETFIPCAMPCSRGSARS